MVAAGEGAATGACRCGAVRFSARVTGTHILACHCATCRALNAGPFLSVRVEDLSFADPAAVATYRATPAAERPFCPRCGATLGFIMTDGSETALSAFLFDPPLDLALAREVHVDEKPAGYSFAGIAPRKDA